MIDAARYDPRDHAIILFLADTGCRVGGIASLTLDNLNLDDGSAWLLEKGSQWRQVWFGEETAQALRRWIDLRPPCDHRSVFTTSAGRGARPLHRRCFAETVHKLSRKAGTSRLYGPHAIRHAVGHALSQVFEPSVVQRKLGHVDASTTINFYFRRDDDYIADISRRHALIAARGSKILKLKINR